MTPTDPTNTFHPDPNGPTADAPPPDSALDAGLAAAFGGDDDTAGSTADFAGKDEHVGAVLAGKYKLIEAIGEGGMGSVYMAQQTEPVKRAVAVKVIKAGMDSKAVLARFEAERQALAMMDHPNIARVLDAGATESGRPFFVMELVKGVPITQFCDERKLTPQQRLELFVPVCNAIQHAHQKGVIHRDIKPSNVLVALYDDRPVPKVIDFGIAKAAGQTLTEHTLVTGLGTVVGTPEYMSPEQASLNNLDIDTRSDVYALGVLLYELLTGSTPVDRKSLGKAALLEVLRIVREVEAPRPSAKLSTSDALPSISANRGTEPKKLTGLLRSELDWIVLRALEKDRTRRYETVNGFAADVRRFLCGEPVQAHPPSTAYRLRKFVRRHRPQVIAASLVFLALVAGVVGTALGRREAWAQRDIARGETAAKETARAEEQKQRTIAEANERVANAEKDKALAAAAEEALARRAEEKERRYAEAINAFVRDDFLALTSVEGQHRFGGAGLDRTATLMDLLNRAAAKLRERKDLDPRVEADLSWMVGVNYRGAGEAGKAIPFLERAVALRKRVLGADHDDTLSAVNSLAQGYRSAGRPDKALPLHEDCYARTKTAFGVDHPHTLNSLNNLALTYSAAGRHDKALPLHEDCYARTKGTLGADHPKTLNSLSSLAAGYQNAGRPDKALPLFERCLTQSKAALGADHPGTLAALNNLAAGYQSAGQMGKALPLFEQCYQQRIDQLGADHPDTLNSQNSLAAGYRAAGRPDKALPLAEECYAKLKGKLGADHPDTLAGLNNLACCYRAAGQPDRALPLQEECHARTKAALGADHPDTLASLNNLATGYYAAGRFGDALPLQEECHARAKAVLGADHPDTLAGLGNLARCYRAAGKPDRALPLQEECYARAKAVLGGDHPDTLASLNSLGKLYCDVRRGKSAVAALTAFIAGMKKRLPPGDPQLAGLLALASQDLLRCGQYATVAEMLRECLAIREKGQPDGWSTFNTRSMLGGALLGQKKYADAEPLLVMGYEGMKAREKTIPKAGGGELRIPQALDRLIELYSATSKPDEVKKYRELRAKYPLEFAPLPRAVK